MSWQLRYFSTEVTASVEAWPVGIREHFMRLIETMAKHGPDLGMPHTKALGAGLFEIRAKAPARHRASFLLYTSWQADRDTACHRQEGPKDTRA